MESADKIAWHLGFYGGMELELRRWKSDLTFETEHELSKEALLMDMLIIKKNQDVRIDKPIGRIFKRYNVIEFKSPEDTLSIDGFYKTIGYACLYKGLGETVNAIPGDELTVSVFCYHHPRKTFDYLEKLGAKIQRKYDGIYYIDGFIRMPVQVVVTKELDWNENHSLRLLTRKADEKEMREYLMDADSLTEPGDIRNASAVLRVCIAANIELFKKVRSEFSMSEDQVLRELLSDLIEEGEAKGRMEGRVEGRMEGAAKVVTEMLREKIPVHIIMKCSEFSADKIAEIAQSIGVTPVTE